MQNTKWNRKSNESFLFSFVNNEIVDDLFIYFISFFGLKLNLYVTTKMTDRDAKKINK